MVKQVLIGAMLAILASGCASEDTSSPDSSSPSKALQEQVATIGEAARDGSFEFVVDAFNCEKKQVGSQYLEETAQGIFCVVELTITNIADEAQSFFSDNQYLYDTDGRRFDTDSAATLVMPNAENFLYNEINPGNKASGTIVFDVPKDARLDYLELHDSMFSDGVEVSVK